MDTKDLPAELARARASFLELVTELRPELHRYCSRLTGSVIEGEDVVQDTLAKAYYSLSTAHELPPLRPLLFRIAHNTALDALRRYEHRLVEPVAEIPEDTRGVERVDPELVGTALAEFLTLPVTQRSAVILKDVLGCTLEEIAEAT
ncbi:MAG TPA: RNA polymerase sigma factor, partial [Polyangiaceae bacterium]|nr:RNA polymerase sigma factor [Polyangiaceae bacterium]